MKLLVLILASFAWHASPVAASPVPDADEPAATAFQEITRHYELVRQRLIRDRRSGVRVHARAIEESARSLQAGFSAERAGVPEKDGETVRALLPEITRAAARLAGAETVTAVREAFHELSKPLLRYRDLARGERPVVVYCPMADKSWLQPRGPIGNPYYGTSMLGCGKVVAE